jgi:hypothetical protein
MEYNELCEIINLYVSISNGDNWFVEALMSLFCRHLSPEVEKKICTVFLDLESLVASFGKSQDLC